MSLVVNVGIIDFDKLITHTDFEHSYHYSYFDTNTDG